MKLTFSLFAAAGSVTGFLILMMFSSCGWDDPCYRNLGVHTTNVVRVDRIALSKDTLTSNETLEVYFWDTVGTSKCYKFSGFEVTKSQNKTDFTVWNSFDQPCGTVCADSLLVMRGYTYRITPPLSAGINYVVVHQPNGSTITETYFVH